MNRPFSRATVAEIHTQGARSGVWPLLVDGDGQPKVCQLQHFVAGQEDIVRLQAHSTHKGVREKQSVLSHSGSARSQGRQQCVHSTTQRLHEAEEARWGFQRAGANRWLECERNGSRSQVMRAMDAVPYTTVSPLRVKARVVNQQISD